MPMAKRMLQGCLMQCKKQFIGLVSIQEQVLPKHGLTLGGRIVDGWSGILSLFIW